MKFERIGEGFNFYRHTPGSISYCATQMRATLEQLGNAEALERLDEVDKACLLARRKRYDWDQRKTMDLMRRQGSRKWDDRVDRTLGALARAPEPYASLVGESEVKRLAVEFGEKLFPAGVRPITTQRYEDQHASVKEILSRLDDEFADHVDKLHLGPIVEQLKEFNRHYGESLKIDSSGVSHSDVEASRVAAEEAFHKLLIKVMHDYMDDLETLNNVLKPFFRQEERLRRHYQRRGSVPEIDPATGEALDPDEAIDLDEEPTADQPADDLVVEPAE